MRAVQAHAQHRGRREHLAGCMGTESADGFEPDLEEPACIWK
jgi:hypothetical protein